MNDNLNEPQPNSASSAPPSQGPPPQPQMGRCVFEPLCDAFRKGAQDARSAAEKAAPRVKAAAADAFYWLAYGVAYAAGFNYHLAGRLSPDSMKNGARNGLQAGKDCAERFRQWWTRPTPEPIRMAPSPASDSPEAPQAGPA